MNQHWQVWYGGLSTDQVTAIIDTCNKYPVAEATIGDVAATSNQAYRRSDVRWINPLVEDNLTNMLWYHALEANRAAFGFHIDYLSEIQFTEYHASNQGKYDWHIDTFWANNRTYDRKVSIVVQLTDPSEYEGGDFEFDAGTPQIDPVLVRQQGTVIVFPSFLSHRVTPVSRGTRRSLVAWVEGPKFR